MGGGDITPLICQFRYGAIASIAPTYLDQYTRLPLSPTNMCYSSTYIDVHFANAIHVFGNNA